MGEYKPLGSEKLQGDDKLKRILELTYFGQKNNINENTTTVKAEVIKETANGVYGIIKEKDGYYVKRGLNESSLDYIGGLFMKNKNKFSSYAEALKRLELLRAQELQEETKFVLKTNKPKEEAPAPAPAVADDAPVGAPMPSASSDDSAPNFGADDSSADTASDSTPNFGADDAEPVGDDASMGDEGSEGGPEHMKEVQRLCGKLGQAIREVQEKMESDDIKYVINMVLSAVDIQKLSEEDKESIVEKFEPEEEGGVPSEEPTGDENPEGGEDFENLPEPKSGESDMDETMDTLENLINSKFDDGEDDVDEHFFYDGYDAPHPDAEADWAGKSVSDEDKPHRLTTSHSMNKKWYDDKDQMYDDFDGTDYDEEDFDDHDSYMGKHGDSIGDLRSKNSFDYHKPIKVRTLKRHHDITPELGDINEAINTTLSKYFE